MAPTPTLTFVLMDPPYENARTTTALRLLDIAARRGYNLNVFAYEGAVYIPFSKQAPHANAVHGRDLAQEDHPNPKDWVEAIIAEAQRQGGTVDWVQCGLCVDERGAAEANPGHRRGRPAGAGKIADVSGKT